MATWNNYCSRLTVAAVLSTIVLDFGVESIGISQSDKPTLPLLKNFPSANGERINVAEQIGTYYEDFGTCLLEDRHGTIVSNMKGTHHNRVISIVTEIVREWLKGRGKRPETWPVFIDCLRVVQLNVLADTIEEEYEKILRGPDLVLLKSFPLASSKKINIAEGIGTHYEDFGFCILNDHHGTIVSNIENSYYHKEVNKIMTDILTQWLNGPKKSRVTWGVFVDCLRVVQLNVLADTIEKQYGKILEDELQEVVVAKVTDPIEEQVHTEKEAEAPTVEEQNQEEPETKVSPTTSPPSTKDMKQSVQESPDKEFREEFSNYLWWSSADYFEYSPLFPNPLKCFKEMMLTGLDQLYLRLPENGFGTWLVEMKNWIVESAYIDAGVFFIPVLFALSFNLMLWLMNMAFGDREEFAVSMLKLCISTITWIWALCLIVFGEHSYFFDLRSHWENWHPGLPIRSALCWLYMVQMGFHLYCVYATLYSKIIRRDWSLMIYHFLMLGLLFSSYIVRFHEIGLLLLFIFDLGNIWLELSKTASFFDLDNEHWGPLLRVLFAIQFVLFRLYWYPTKIIYSAMHVSVKVFPNGWTPFHLLFVPMLWSLYALQDLVRPWGPIKTKRRVKKD